MNKYHKVLFVDRSWYLLSWQTCGRRHYGPRQSKRSFYESSLRCIAWWPESMSQVSLHAARTWGESTDSLPEGEKISWNTYLDLKRHHPGELGLWPGSTQLHFRLSGKEFCFFAFSKIFSNEVDLLVLSFRPFLNKTISFFMLVP